MSTIAPERSAARRAYDIVEIRQKIWQNLKKRDLAVCLRLEKAGMHEVVKELYYEVPYSYILTRDGQAITDLNAMYTAAIRIINAENLELSPAHQTDLNIYPPYIRSEKFRRYWPKITEDIAWRVRVGRPSIRLVKFGIGRSRVMPGEEFWTVDLTGDKSAPGIDDFLFRDSTGILTKRSGHIDHVTSISLSLSSPPPKTIIPKVFEPPTTHFTLSSHFDVTFKTNKDGSYRRYADEWLQAFREHPSFARLHTFVNFGRFPISLDDIGQLIQRQIDTESPYRLQGIYASRILTWSLTDLRSFSVVAGSSLVLLVLAHNYNPKTTTISFRDLPALKYIIKHQLPHLRNLELSMNGIDTAEADCWNQMSQCPVDLTQTGKLRHLDIYTARSDTPRYNLIRSLSDLVNDPCLIYIGPKNWNYGDRWAPHEQRDFLSYIRRQSTERRFHLAKIDFVPLRVERSAGLEELEYDFEGRPHSRWTTKSAQWHTTANLARQNISVDLVPDLQIGMRNLVDSTKRLNLAETACAPTSELFQNSQMILSAVEQCQEAMEKARAMLDKVDKGDLLLYRQFLRGELAREKRSSDLGGNA